MQIFINHSQQKLKTQSMNQKPSAAFIAASWIAIGAGAIGYLIGLWRADMQLNEKGYYFTILMFGLFAVVSLQKSVRDRLENLPVQIFIMLFAGLPLFCQLYCW
jgi:uncharacterized membrane protein YiaA